MGKTVLRKPIAIVDAAALEALPTKVLLVRLRHLQRCEESAAASDMDPDEVTRATGIIFKDDPEWMAAYTQLKALLARREHVPKGEELRAVRLERARVAGSVERRRRRRTTVR